MFYVVWRNQQGDVGGFIEEDDSPEDCFNGLPKSWPTEKAAKDAMKGHMLEHFSEIIEL